MKTSTMINEAIAASSIFILPVLFMLVSELF